MKQFIIKELDYGMYKNAEYTPSGDYLNLDVGVYLDSHGNLFVITVASSIPACIFMSFSSVYGDSLIEIEEPEDAKCNDTACEVQDEEESSTMTGTMVLSGAPMISEGTLLRAIAVLSGQANYDEIE